MELPVRTKLANGLEAIVLWNSDTGVKPLIGAYFTTDWGWIPISWTKEGHYHTREDLQKKYCHLDLNWVVPEPQYA